MKKVIFKSLVILLLFTLSNSISDIKLLSDPILDFSTKDFGYNTIRMKWTFSMVHDEKQIDNLVVYIRFPFQITVSSTKWRWSAITDTCETIKSLTEVTGQSLYDSSVGNDPDLNAVVFIMTAANFSSTGIYYSELETTEQPTTQAFYEPVRMRIISTAYSHYFVTFASNNSIARFYHTVAADTTNISVQVPTQTDTNAQKISKQVKTLIDVKDVDGTGEKIFFKLEKAKGWSFANDAESTCTFVSYSISGFATSLPDYYCQFESAFEKTGLYFILKTGTLPANVWVRVQLNIRNTDVPNTTTLNTSIMPKFGPIVTKFKALASSSTTNMHAATISFDTSYPIVYYGPFLDTTSTLIPPVELYASGSSTNRIVFNSITVKFKLQEDQPTPAATTSYWIKIRIGETVNNGKASVPQSFIYDNMPLADGFTRKEYSVTTNSDIIIKNISSLLSLSTYTIGFKIALDSTNRLTFGGDASNFCAIEIDTSTGSTVVTRAWPPNMQTIHKTTTPVTNTFMLSEASNPPTYFHSLSSITLATLQTITNANYGMLQGVDMNLFIWGNFNQNAGTVTESYLEVIMNKDITINYTGDQSTATVTDQCFCYNDSQVDVTAASVKGCRHDVINQGNSGNEYSRLRAGATASTFWGDTSTTSVYWGWKLMTLSKQNSYYMNDSDAVIMDAYIFVYTSQTGGLTDTWATSTISEKRMDNMLVKVDTTVMNNLSAGFANYFYNSGSQLDGTEVPTFLRIYGTLNGIQTVNAQKLMIFYNEFEPLFSDSDNYEISCGLSNAGSITCKHYDFLKLSGDINKSGIRTCASTECGMTQYRNAIEVHISSNIMSTANAIEIQVLVPIKITSASTINTGTKTLGIGVATSHSGGFSAFNQMLYYKEITLTVPSSYSATAALSSLKMSSSTVNSQQYTSTANLLFKPNTILPAKIGSYYTTTIDIDCNKASSACDLTNAGEYWSWTICAPWNFMQSSTFSVTNTQKLISTTPVNYQNCIKSLNVYISSALRYCLWCPMWIDGEIDSSLPITNFYIPDDKGLKYPAATWSAFSGLNVGQLSLADLNGMNGDSFASNHIHTVSVDPTIQYKGQKSQKISITMSMTNRVIATGQIKIIFNAVGPFTFNWSANEYCFVTDSGSTRHQQNGAVSTVTNANDTITLSNNFGSPNDIVAGVVTIEIYGIIVATSPAADYISFSVKTYQDSGATMLADDSIIEVGGFEFQPNPSGSTHLNKLEIKGFEFLQVDKNAIGAIQIKIKLGNSKYLSYPDRLEIELPSALGYNTGAAEYPVLCTILSWDGTQILTKMNVCKVNEDLTTSAKFYQESQQDTTYNQFIVEIQNFRNPTTSTTVSVDSTLTSLSNKSGAGPYTYTQTTAQDAVATLSVTSPTVPTNSLATCSVSKKFNYVGIFTEYTFTIVTTSFAITNDSVIKITFGIEYTIDFDSIIHHSGKPNSYKWDQLYNSSDGNKRNIVKITGFTGGVSAGNSLLITINGVYQPTIVGRNGGSDEEFYVVVYDNSGVLQESGRANVAVGTVINPASINLFWIEDFSFSGGDYSTYNYKHTADIRATTDLTFSFTYTGSVSAGGYVHVFQNMLDLEYSVLYTNLVCTMVNNSNAVISNECFRLGRRVTLRLTSGLTANIKHTITITNLLNKNYKACEIKKVDVYIEYSNSLVAIAPSEVQNIIIYDIIENSSKIYLSYDGLIGNDILKVTRGLYNKIKVIRNDSKRFNNQLTFKLTNDQEGQFVLQSADEFIIKDSYLGMVATPFFIGTKNSALSTVFMLEIERTETYTTNEYATLPALPIEVSQASLSLPVESQIRCYRSYETLPLILELTQYPVEDVQITLSIETLNSNSAQAIKSGISNPQTINKSNVFTEIIVTSSHSKSADPISDDNAKLVLTPSAGSSFGTTYVTQILDDLTVDSSVKFGIEFKQISKYSCAVNINIHMPLTIYWYIVPTILYADIPQANIQANLSKGQKTDGFIQMGYKNLEQSITDFDICEGTLQASTSYIIKVYYKSFTVQSVVVNSPVPSSSTSTFDLLKYTDLNYYNQWNTNESENSVIPDLDEGSVHTSFTMDAHGANFGYFNITFNSELTDAQIKSLCCYVAQVSYYPLENIWSSEGLRCLSPNANMPSEIYYYTACPTTRLLDQVLNNTSSMDSTRNYYDNSKRILQNSESNIAKFDKTALPQFRPEKQERKLTTINTENQIFILRNLRYDQDEGAYDNIATYLYPSTFETNLASRESSFPAYTSKTPLLALAATHPTIKNFATADIFETLIEVNITGIQMQSTGFIYSMLLKKTDDNVDKLITYQHLKKATSPLCDQTAKFTNKTHYQILSEKAWYYINEIEKDVNYIFYYFGTTDEPDVLSTYTPIYKLEFISRSIVKPLAKSNLLEVYCTSLLIIVFWIFI